MKERIPTFKVILKEDTEVFWNKEENSIEFRNSNGEVSDKHLISFGQSYNRVGKTPKVLREVNHPSGSISFEQKAVVYDRSMAIDTSYKKHGKNFLCVAACISIEQDVDKSGQLRKGEQIKFLQWPRLVFLAKYGSKPERYGWMKYIEALIKSDAYLIDREYGVIVDSDLGEIPHINSREISLFDDFYLPKNMSLIYASADVGKENFMNKLIKETDRHAALTLKTVMKKFQMLEGLEIESEFFDIEVPNDYIKINL